jgi:hypothetical protein
MAEKMNITINHITYHVRNEREVLEFIFAFYNVPMALETFIEQVR